LVYLLFKYSISAVVENLAEMRPEMCLEAAQQGLIQWLLKRLKAKMPFDSNKLYVSEILSILLHAIPGNRAILGENGGIDILLQQLAVSLTIIIFVLIPFVLLCLTHYQKFRICFFNYCTIYGYFL